MARKNISIGLDTWQELAALGRFGMTFDDIVKILLTEHRELDKLRSRLQAQEVEPEQAIRELFNEVDKVIPTAGYYRAAFGATKSRQPQSQQPQQQQMVKTAISEIEEYKQHTQSPHLHIFDKDTAQPIPIGEKSESGKRNIRMEMIFPEIKFPVKKHELVERSKND